VIAILSLVLSLALTLVVVEARAFQFSEFCVDFPTHKLLQQEINMKGRLR
jgi:hypothetical protein